MPKLKEPKTEWITTDYGDKRKIFCDCNSEWINPMNELYPQFKRAIIEVGRCDKCNTPKWYYVNERYQKKFQAKYRYKNRAKRKRG